VLRLLRLRKYIIAPGLGLCLLIAGLLHPQTARAEGSSDLTQTGTGGYRPFLLYDELGALGNIPNTTAIKVYAQVGEFLNMGSSANGLGDGVTSGIIRYESPSGVDYLCPVTGVIGRITSRAQELNGVLPGGYTPCQQLVNESGVWEVTFVSPNPLAGNADNPPRTLLATDLWDLAVDPDAQPTTVRWIRAWDVTVSRVAAPATAADLISGRVYADYMPLNMGANIEGMRVFTSIVHVYTEDGYIYEVNMNGIDAFGFQFLSNNKGFRDATGAPIFRSVQLTGPNANQNFPPGFDIHLPNLPDTQFDQTHKIFFNYPDTATFDLLDNANVPSPSGPVKFQFPPIPPEAPLTLEFYGSEANTPGNAGTAPLTGYFRFNAPRTATYSITLDVNRDGIYGNTPDRVLNFYAANPGIVDVVWDGLDEVGNRVLAGDVGYDVQVVMYAGEVHFPFLDPEFNVEGIILNRVLDPGTTIPPPAPGLVYWDDTYNYNGTNTYDYSLCAQGELPLPPVGSGVELDCHGMPQDERSAPYGIDSIARGGAHRWLGGVAQNPPDPLDETVAGFGDIRAMDTWAKYPSATLQLNDLVRLREVDLSVVKTHAPEPVAAGGPVTFTIVVANAGPSDAIGADFYDDFPPELLVSGWTCAPQNPGAACPANGVGDIPAANPVKIDLPRNTSVIFTFNATVDPNLPVGTTVINYATVLRPLDVTELDDLGRTGAGNNTDDDPIIITAATATPLISDTPSPTATPTASPTASPTPTDTTGSATATPTVTGTLTATITGTLSATPTVTGTLSNTPTGTLSNTPTATITGTRSATPTPSGTWYTETPGVGTPPGSGTLTATPTDSLLTLDKRVNPPFALPGEEVVWTITFTNPTNVDVKNVVLTDVVPPELQIISVSSTMGTAYFFGQTVKLALDTLPAGGSVTVTVVTRVRDTAQPPYILRNAAQLCTDNVCIGDDASIASVTTLPRTGESPWQGVRYALMLTTLVLLMSVGAMMRVRRVRR
jgi:uncharacterized repeat protein (TIGR01451 family)